MSVGPDRARVEELLGERAQALATEGATAARWVRARAEFERAAGRDVARETRRLFAVGSLAAAAVLAAVVSLHGGRVGAVLGRAVPCELTLLDSGYRELDSTERSPGVHAEPLPPTILVEVAPSEAGFVHLFLFDTEGARHSLDELFLFDTEGVRRPLEEKPADGDAYAECELARYGIDPASRRALDPARGDGGGARPPRSSSAPCPRGWSTRASTSGRRSSSGSARRSPRDSGASSTCARRRPGDAPLPCARIAEQDEAGPVVGVRVRARRAGAGLDRSARRRCSAALRALELR